MDNQKDYKAEDRKIIVGSKTWRLLRFCLFLIFLKVLFAIGLTLYLLNRVWSNQEGKTKLTVDADPELEIPGLIDEKSKLHYESIMEEYVLDSTFAFFPDDQVDNNDSKQEWNIARPPYPIRNHRLTPPEVLETLKTMIECNNRELKSELFQHNDYWVLKNFFHAGHGEINCYGSVTYVTHGTLMDLVTLPVLVKRWEGPVSVAIYAPGTDFEPTINALYYVLNCLPESPLLRLFVSIHIYFDYEFTPSMVWKNQYYKSQRHVSVNCSQPPLYQSLTPDALYIKQMNLMYPANVGRNIARDAALTHFILDAEIDMYPSQNLGRRFMEMVAASKNILQGKSLRVFALPVFGISLESYLPLNINDLNSLQKQGKALLLPDEACYQCNILSKQLDLNGTENEDINVVTVVKRIGPFKNWQPYLISTVDEPYHNERVSHDSGLDRNAQAYTLCTLDYEFHLLGNVFLMRHMNISNKQPSPNPGSPHWYSLREQTEAYLLRVLYPNMKKIYGFQHGCNILERRLANSSSVTFL